MKYLIAAMFIFFVHVKVPFGVHWKGDVESIRILPGSGGYVWELTLPNGTKTYAPTLWTIIKEK